MVGQEYNFNQLTSEEVHLQRNMMIMMLLVMIIIVMMIINIIIIMITYDYYYYNYDDDADDDDHRDDVDMVERHLMETCNRVCTNSVQRYKPAKQIFYSNTICVCLCRNPRFVLAQSVLHQTINQSRNLR